MRVDINDTGMDQAMRYTYDGEPFTGEIVETDRHGHLTGLITVKDGVPHGPDRDWYPDGTLESETMLTNGYVVGVARQWHPNGLLAEEREFDGRGHMVGARRWDENGAALPAPDEGGFTYFGSIPPGRTRARIAGVLRRHMVDGHPVDEVFTRDLHWKPTVAMIGKDLGHGDTEYVEISGTEASAFVERITRRFSGDTG